MHRTGLITAIAGGLIVSGAAMGAPAGTVLWAHPLGDSPMSKTAKVGPDGTIYLHAGDLFAINPDGSLKWRRTPPITDSVRDHGPVAIDAAGNVYVSTPRDLSSYDADGNLRWTFRDLGATAQLAGPGVGPDGNVYQINHSGGGLGAFSLTSDGDLRWAMESPGFSDHGFAGHEIVFSGGNFYAALDDRGVRRATMDAISLDGEYEWGVFINDSGEVVIAPDGDPVFSQNNVVYRYNADGSEQFAYGVGGAPSVPCLDDDGNTYFFTFKRFLYKLDPNGGLVMQRTYNNGWGVSGGSSQDIGGAIAPGGETMVIVADDIDRNPSTIRGIDINSGDELWHVELPVVPGTEYDYITSAFAGAVFSHDGTVAYVPVRNFFEGWLYAVQVVDTEDSESLTGDLDGDGVVASSDLGMLLGSWGEAPGSVADLDGDGWVTSVDLALLLGSWGSSN
ncbi:MAG: PQQ-binding-like beta-propeller repeat protein [Planctomycetota bacterium]|nr:PQQ-binding-like beta-propeller repeat protein [Planctomycetota bacterium]